ncbi:extracellular solute-binding protein [Microbacterium sp. ASV49]|uniref:Extracellular solute-binding protein n=1 Tax=Microbacterium candidum TaxID=3041922 RepID=A0ABT7MWR7_9MICO|nr:extracellular solute-binding protein [Microbacterium sp. ASV49]MDL9978887.1 extracellular solute-binding protein [Microbacterium sp. ASV49]
MNRRGITRVAAGLLAVGVAAGALAGCSGSSSSGSSDGKVTLTWWHNGNQDPLKGLWADVAKEFEKAHPNVTVKVTGYQNEDLQKTLIPNALRSNNPPDLFQAWGGGELKDQVAAGYVKDISADVKDELASIGPTASGWQIDGKTYGLPFSYGIEGFWYNKDLFAKAGITDTPKTFDELNADIAKLKAANITPIAVGAGDKWPAAHWWYNFALKDCSPETLKKAQSKHVFDDQCFVKAGQDLQTFITTNPFNEGFLATPAQQGAGSSAGLLANGKAAMELMGHWEPGVVGGLTADKKVPSWMGWFNFPGITGAAGDPTAALGGGDGFACAKNAPKECVELLKYILSPDVQKRFAESGAGIPTVKEAASAVADPNLQAVLKGKQDASYVQLWLDTAYGTTVGGAMNDGIVNLFAGKGTPEDIVKGMKDAAATE